jgi:DNA-binding NtrC family response regulator/tetratricopeptide (TPR) repeat protein
LSDRGLTGGEYGFSYLGQGSLTVCEGPETARLAVGAAASLTEWEALVGQGRYGEALGVASRALERTKREEDLALRLRIARGLALWLSGRVAPGRSEIEKVLDSSTQPLTLARAHEASGLMAWRAQDPEGAGRHLDAALGLYESSAYHVGSVRALLKKAGVLRDAGRVAEAQCLVQQALDLASGLQRSDLVSEARVAQCALFLAQGLWAPARGQIEGGESGGALEVYRRLLQVALGLAEGDLAFARDGLSHARKALALGSDPRGTAEGLLLASDLELAAGHAGEAVSLATEAHGVFASLQERDGECRSRVRLAHALLARGDVALAIDEARRAVALAPPTRAGLVAMSLLTLGRTLLRTSRVEAARAFDEALEAIPDGPFAVAARLGRALARGSCGSEPEVMAALAELESWGDRRIFSYSLSDVRELCGAERSGVAVEPRLITVADPVGEALVEAARALRGVDEWKARWHTVMRAVGEALPWWRAVLVDSPGWELRRDLDSPQVLSPHDLAVELAAIGTRPGVIDLLGDTTLRRHPTRVLHGLGAAMLTPLTSAGVLYVDVREESLPLPERASAFLLHLGRMIDSFRIEAPPDTEEETSLGFPGLVGRSAAMQELFREMRLVAPLDVAVHVFGETGTGKEKVAHALHRLSRRREGPWVAVNAASLNDELFESEMFGHVKGAFTGALSDRRGYVPEAEGGTLFLDEITDLSSRAQAKLLRFVQEREYRRLGETHLVHSDVRIVTASNVSLEERVAAGLFRSDLMYRLSQATLTVPPLRERGEDILLLGRHFVRELARRSGMPAPALGQEAARALLRHTWPGNVRELESEMVRALCRAGTGPLGGEHLSAAVARPQVPRAPLKQSLLACERAEITRALSRHQGNRTRAAWDLGLSRQALLAKINRLGIACPRR